MARSTAPANQLEEMMLQHGKTQEEILLALRNTIRDITTTNGQEFTENHIESEAMLMLDILRQSPPGDST